MRRDSKGSSGAGGFSYVEVLVAVVLLAVALVPALDSLHPGLIGAALHADVSREHYRLTAKMEAVLVEPFDTLDDAATAAGGPDAATTYSDAGGEPNRRLVFLSRYDGDNADGDDDPFTGKDATLLWVRVRVEGTTKELETLLSR